MQFSMGKVKVLPNSVKFGKVYLMKFLAFDIEAANGYMLSSICSVGVVIADEQFNVLSRENIWINPKTKYNLNGTRANVGIDLHLDKALLSASPDFAKVYPRLKSLLTDPQYVVFGHAVDSDVRMLNKACERYRLPSIDFEFVCSQLLYRLYKGEKEIKALHKIADELGVTFQQHKSEEDAYVSMLTMKYLVESSGLTVDELLDKYRVRKGVNKNFVLTRPVTLAGQVSNKKLTQVAIERIKEYNLTVQKTGSKYRNVAFCLARSLELSDGEQLYAVLNKIIQNGGRYTAKLIKGNVYVKSDNPIEQDVMREKRVAELEEQGLIKVVTIDDVLEGRV